MENEASIITVGLAPAWDITCRGRNIDWGRHQHIDEQTILPAGKAFNVSQALSWAGQASIAAGLWGDSDFDKMRAISSALWPLIDIKMTVVVGQTRSNITVVDTANQREMHLRRKSDLISEEAMRRLESDLGKIIKKGDYCVFSGAMPENEYLDEILGIIEKCHNTGAKIVLDTYGFALKRVIRTGLVWMIKPNVAEFRGLFEGQIKDNPDSLIKSGQSLLRKVENILISRGKEGAILINKDGAWQCKAINSGEVLGTVGCGDYLLAGFLKSWKENAKEDYALSIAVKLATAKAWGWTLAKNWQEVMNEVQIELSLVK